jgi:hypothetical protein
MNLFQEMKNNLIRQQLLPQVHVSWCYCRLFPLPNSVSGDRVVCVIPRIAIAIVIFKTSASSVKTSPSRGERVVQITQANK